MRRGRLRRSAPRSSPPTARSEATSGGARRDWTAALRHVRSEAPRGAGVWTGALDGAGAPGAAVRDPATGRWVLVAAAPFTDAGRGVRLFDAAGRALDGGPSDLARVGGAGPRRPPPAAGARQPGAGDHGRPRGRGGGGGARRLRRHLGLDRLRAALRGRLRAAGGGSGPPGADAPSGAALRARAAREPGERAPLPVLGGGGALRHLGVGPARRPGVHVRRHRRDAGLRRRRRRRRERSCSTGSPRPSAAASAWRWRRAKRTGAFDVSFRVPGARARRCTGSTPAARPPRPPTAAATPRSSAWRWTSPRSAPPRSAPRPPRTACRTPSRACRRPSCCGTATAGWCCATRPTATSSRSTRGCSSPAPAARPCSASPRWPSGASTPSPPNAAASARPS